MDRYFFDFNFGYNGSENFATGHQFDLFPALSAAWNIAEEKFIQDNLSGIHMLKIRYSYGKVGNDYTTTRFPYLAYVTHSATVYNCGDIESTSSYTGLTYLTIASNSAAWEIATKHNLGFGLSLFNGKIDGAIDFCH